MKVIERRKVILDVEDMGSKLTYGGYPISSIIARAILDYLAQKGVRLPDKVITLQGELTFEFLEDLEDAEALHTRRSS